MALAGQELVNVEKLEGRDGTGRAIRAVTSQAFEGRDVMSGQ